MLFFVTPTLLLGHLSGLMPGPLKDTLLAVFVVLTAVFASRKYTQEIKDDIGDKSVFECGLCVSVHVDAPSL